MVIQVWSGEKPALPRRALLGCSVMMGIAGLLAADMTHRRGGDALGSRYSPREWQISFQAPRRFGSPRAALMQRGQALMFGGRMRDRTRSFLAVYQLSAPAPPSAEAVCDAVLRSHAGSEDDDGASRRHRRTDVTLGPLKAVEIRDEGLSIVVRGAIGDHGEAYAICLGLDHQPIDVDTQAYRLFEATCASVERKPH